MCYDASTDIEIVTDSQYTIDMVERVIADPVLEHFGNVSNRDLAAVLIQLLHQVSYKRAKLRKIKSHQTILPSHTAGEALDILGNAFADETAKLCAMHFTTAWDEIQKQVDNYALKQ